eukprot:TRINITY_DN1863_c0_g1_i6.p1 TRINITY_DN1863_c0_g1~~TRINITY_DN1863_c0_g1_i6.p1  ORF type:complete len:608 (-),score=85.23 TRINITY_DN1863_c0_g1_i6:1245-3068(-)
MEIARVKHEEFQRHDEEVNRITSLHTAERAGLNRSIERLNSEVQVLRERVAMQAADIESIQLREKEIRFVLSKKLADTEYAASSLKGILNNLGDTIALSEFAPKLDPRVAFPQEIHFPFEFDESSRSSKSIARIRPYLTEDIKAGVRVLEDKYRTQLHSLNQAIIQGNSQKRMVLELEANISKLEDNLNGMKLSNPITYGLKHVGCQTMPLDIPLPAASTKAAFTEPWAIFFDSFRTGYGQAWSFHQVIKQIDQIYADKIQHDKISDSEHRPRVNFQQFVHIVFKNKYGLEQLAEQHLTDFLEGVHTYHADNLRILTFAKFLGFFTPYSLNNLNLYLHTLDMIHASIIGASIPETITGITLISLSRAIDVARNLFTDRTPEEMARFVHEIESISETTYRSNSAPRAMTRPSSGKSISRPSSSGSRPRSANAERSGEETMEKIIAISMDKFILQVMEEAQKESPATDKYLSKLFVASDIYNDGELDFSEFVSIVRFADPSCSIDLARQLFRDHSDPRSGRLTLVGFLRIGRKYNYASSWMPFLRPINSSESTVFLLLHKIASFSPKMTGMRDPTLFDGGMIGGIHFYFLLTIHPQFLLCYATELNMAY